MSMYMNFVRVTPDTFDKIKKDENLLESIFFEDEDETCKKLGIQNDHIFGVDYMIASEALEAMAEAMGEDIEDDAVFEDLCITGNLNYDVGYGEAFFLEPKAVKKAFAESSIPELDLEAKSNFEIASKQGDYIIGVIS